MPVEANTPEPPTYFANIVSMTLDPDQMIIELRQNLPGHRGTIPHVSTPGITETTPPTPQEIMNLEPVARVVLTFTAVRALKQYLDKAFPMIEAKRTTGR